MCGIVGVCAAQPITDRAWIAKGRDAMSHRGPDDSGEWWSADARVGFGHRRLAILDLSSLGHQPMHDETKRLTIVFNGEIYNHDSLRNELRERGYLFRSHSDTEVLLAAYDAWGEDCLSRLNGMFAMAIYDAKRRTLFLARDRAGEKPLFYRLSHGVLQFGSELKALLSNPSNPRRIDTEALDCYLAMGYVPGERCILQGYNKLPPAHALSFNLDSGHVHRWRYWTAPTFSPEVGGERQNEVILLNELEALLEDAVGRQLLADVPVGILLSGGLDSSLITAMAVRRSRHVQTFSIGFAGHGNFDERPHARLIASYFGTEHIELVAKPAVAEFIPRLVQQFDEPVVDSSMIPSFLVSQLVRRHCKVALGGDGGDELFGGYSEYSRLIWLQRRLRWIPSNLRKVVASTAEHFLSQGFARSNIKAWLLATGQNFNHDLPLIANYFTPTFRQKLLQDHIGYEPASEDIRRSRIPAEPDLLQRMTRMDFQNYMPEDILVKVDRTSMLNSLEIRAPLLDFRLIDFAFGRVPSNLKANSRQKKILLKRLAARILPKDFDMQRKQGFSIPLDDWLKSGPFRDLFWETLGRTDCFFNRNAIKDLLDGQDRGMRNGERLFALVQFELWCKRYGATL